MALSHCLAGFMGANGGGIVEAREHEAVSVHPHSLAGMGEYEWLRSSPVP